MMLWLVVILSQTSFGSPLCPLVLEITFILILGFFSTSWPFIWYIIMMSKLRIFSLWSLAYKMIIISLRYCTTFIPIVNPWCNASDGSLAWRTYTWIVIIIYSFLLSIWLTDGESVSTMFLTQVQSTTLLIVLIKHSFCLWFIYTFHHAMDYMIKKWILFSQLNTISCCSSKGWQ